MSSPTLVPPTVLITGASGGIGAVYTDRFARRGHDLLLVARSASRLTEVADRLRRETGVAVQTLPADLTDPPNWPPSRNGCTPTSASRF